jgi:hypothetical protein
MKIAKTKNGWGVHDLLWEGRLVCLGDFHSTQEFAKDALDCAKQRIDGGKEIFPLDCACVRAR